MIPQHDPYCFYKRRKKKITHKFYRRNPVFKLSLFILQSSVDRHTFQHSCSHTIYSAFLISKICFFFFPQNRFSKSYFLVWILCDICAVSDVTDKRMHLDFEEFQSDTAYYWWTSRLPVLLPREISHLLSELSRGACEHGVRWGRVSNSAVQFSRRGRLPSFLLRGTTALGWVACVAPELLGQHCSVW